jgi:hypothetical protein
MSVGTIGVVLVIGAALVFEIPAQAQVSRWASPDEPTAKALIELERKWAEAACTHNGIEKTILAEDFHGIDPDGAHYSKKEAVEGAKTAKTERECKMYEVKVHFFGENMAILYGSETAVHASTTDGRQHTTKLTWTDTWLKRDGKWQVVAAEDMPSEVK